MTFIDAWFVWFLALSQPNVPNTAVTRQPGRVTAVVQPPVQQVSLYSSTGGASQPTDNGISGRGVIREIHGISNGY